MNIENLEIPSPFVQRWLQYAFSVPENQFVPRDRVATLVAEPFFQARAISDFFIKREINPHVATKGVDWSVHASAPQGVDLVRALYETQSYEAMLVEGPTFVLLQAFLFYKRIGKRVDFEPPDTWFSAEARRVLLELQASGPR